MLALPLTLCLTLSLSVSLTCSLLRRNNKKSVNLTPSSDARLSIFTVFVVWCWSGPEGEHHARNPTNCLDNMYRQSRLIDRLQFYPIYICGSLVSVFSCPESIYVGLPLIHPTDQFLIFDTQKIASGRMRWMDDVERTRAV